jgi:glycosyltransferase involved in cell wall biosynthesis
MNPTPSLNADYLLVMFSLPVHVDEQGRRYLDPLWLKDLVEHARYLPRLSLACPRTSGAAPPAHYMAVDTAAELQQLQWIDLPPAHSTWQALRQLPQTFTRLARALKHASIVHSSIVSWPIPEAWVLLPLLALQPKFHLIVVESAPWRLLPGEAVSRRQRLRARLWEFMARHCLRRCDLAFYTQDEYRGSLHAGAPERAHVIPASWIDASRICTSEQAHQSWDDKTGASTLRLLFAGRLTRAKGVEVLLDSVLELARRGQALELVILGDGELRPACQAAASRIAPGSKIQVLGNMPYDESFFAQLRRAHAVVVPSLSDEQPRILYDAWSQAVPVIASQTPGLADRIKPGVNGWLCEVGSVSSLGEILLQAAAARGQLRRMGLSALESAHALTHREMHRQRLEHILQHYPQPQP